MWWSKNVHTSATHTLIPLRSQKGKYVPLDQDSQLQVTRTGKNAKSVCSCKSAASCLHLLWQSANVFDSFVSRPRHHSHLSTGGNPQGVLAALGEPITMALNNFFHCVISSLLACYCNICPAVECCSCLRGTNIPSVLILIILAATHMQLTQGTRSTCNSSQYIASESMQFGVFSPPLLY